MQDISSSDIGNQDIMTTRISGNDNSNTLNF